MIDPESRDNELANRLLAEDRLTTTDSLRRTSAETARWFEVVLAHEQDVERRIRTAAVWAWSALFALGLVFAVGYYFFHGGESTASVEGGRGMMIVAAALFTVVLVAAMALTFTWLYRGRTVSLAMVERRLAALEELLARRS